MTNSPLSMTGNILEDITDAVCAVDEHWKVTYMNAAAENMLGQHKEWISLVEPALTRAASAKQPVVFDLAQQGSRFSAKAYPRKEGGAVIWFRDVTISGTGREGQEDIAMQLHQTQESLAVALEAAKMGIWNLNLFTGQVQRSLRHDQIFGYTTLQPAWTTETVLEQVVPEDQQLFRESVAQAYKTGMLKLECRVRWPDKSLHWISSQGHVVYDKKGEAMNMTGVIMDITGRKEAEENLRHSKDRLKRAMETAKLGTWELDLASNKMTSSAVCKANFGLSPYVDLSYKLLYKYIHPEDRQRVWDTVRQAIETGENYQTEYRSVWPNGEVHWILARGQVHYAGGEPQRLIGVTLDITGLKRAEEKPWHYKMFFNAAPNPYLVLTPSLKIEAVNEAYLKATGTKREDIVGRQLFEVFPGNPEDQRSRDLQEINEELRIINERLAREIRERKAAEEALRYSEERLRLIIESAKEYAIFTMDLNGRITSWNKGAEQLLGYREADVLGKDAALIYMPEDREARMPVRERRKALLEDRAEHERWQMRHDGSRFWASGLIMPLLNEAGNLHGYLNILRDHTEKKQMEEALQEALKETGDKNRELLRLNEYMDNFVHIIAHDLRSPLSTLRLVSDLIVQTESWEEKMRYIPMMENAVNHLGNMMNDVIELISVQNKPESSVTQVSFEEVFETVRAEYRQALEECGASVKTAFACPRIFYIKVFIQSILMNLLGNAIKYKADDRALEISITTKRENDFIILSFGDNGMGMDLEKYRGNLFKPFTRFTNKAEGKGMGLHLVKSMVEKKGGRIEADSTPDKGTTFTVYLREY